jgi:hypothetical protein
MTTETFTTSAAARPFITASIARLLEMQGCDIASITLVVEDGHGLDQRALHPVVYGEVDGRGRARIIPFGGAKACAAESHTICAKGEDYGAAADRIMGMIRAFADGSGPLRVEIA